MMFSTSSLNAVLRPARVWFVAALVLSSAPFLLARDATNVFSKSPYLQAPGSNTMTLMWESLTNRPGAVRYGLSGKLDQQLGPVEPLAMPGFVGVKSASGAAGFSASSTNVFFLYAAVLTNLQPGARYSYRVELDGVPTPTRRFKTLDPKTDKVRFIAYGDSRSYPKTHAAVARQLRRYAPDFILHTGDLVARGPEYALWSKEYFLPLAGVIDEVPLLPALGNHEWDGTNFFAYFHLPGGRRWYAFDYGPVHVLALDFHFESATNEQFQFARQDLLASQAPWKIVIVHCPMFNWGHHNSTWGHAAYLPLFHEARVDLVLTGHSHLYERFRPVAAESGAGAWAITHITAGGGGAELGASLAHPAHAAAARTNHFVVFDATPDRLRGRTFTAGGQRIDAFEIKKKGGVPVPKYLARVYSEKLLQQSFEIGTNLLGKLAAAPTNSQPAQVMFTLPPLTSAPRLVELEISVAPGSAAKYQLENGPVRVTTPAAGEPAKTVWASVRASGESAVSGSDLTPALAFQARIKSESGETLAYGPRSRLSQTAADAAKKRAAAEAGK